MFFRNDLNIYAFVGIIMLIGLVKKNAIMMIDFAIEQALGAKDSHADAITGLSGPFPPDHDDDDGGADRHVPIAMGSAPGRRIAAAGGPVGRRRPALLAGITLYVTPVFYVYMENIRTGSSGGSPRSSQFSPSRDEHAAK